MIIVLCVEFAVNAYKYYTYVFGGEDYEDVAITKYNTG